MLVKVKVIDLVQQNTCRIYKGLTYQFWKEYLNQVHDVLFMFYMMANGTSVSS